MNLLFAAAGPGYAAGDTQRPLVSTLPPEDDTGTGWHRSAAMPAHLSP